MHTPFFCICLLFTLIYAHGQNTAPHNTHPKTKKEQLQRLAELCDSLNYIERYDKTRQVSRMALSIADEDDHYNRSLFHYYIGVSYNGVINDSAIFYFDKSLQQARIAKNEKRIRNALHELLYMYINVEGYTSKRDSAAAEVGRILDTTANSSTKIRCYGILADYYSAIGWYEQELNYRLQGIELSVAEMQNGQYSNTNADSTNIGVAYFNVGYLYDKLNQYAKAQEYYRRSKPLLWNYMAGIASYYKGMATTALKQDDAAAVQQYTDSLRRLVEQKMDIHAGWDILLELYLDQADHYLDRQNAVAAMPYLRQAETLIGTKITENRSVSAFRYAMGKALTVQQKYAEALPYLQKAEMSESAFSAAVYARLLRTLADCYQGLNQWENADRYYAKYLPLRDSLEAKTAQQSMANAEARFQNKEKIKEIEVQKVQISFAHRQRLWLTVGIVALVLLAGLLLLFYRNKKRNADRLARLNAALEEANRTKARLFSIIGHDLRSPISQVYQFLKLQQLRPDALSMPQKEELSNKIQKATGSLLETMEDLLLWSKTQMNEFKTSVQPVGVADSVEQALSLLQLNLAAKNLQVDNQIPASLVFDTDPYYLQTIMRNLLQNAVKASPDNGRIVLCADMESISVANEGTPFTQEQYVAVLQDNEGNKGLTGLGLKLTDELSRKIGATIHFDTWTAGYTTAVLRF